MKPFMLIFAFLSVCFFAQASSNDSIVKVLSVDEENKQVKLTIKEKKQKKFLEEKGAGFAPLKENLDRWIEEKLEDLKKN